MVAIAARAHEPITTKLTWTQEISRIIYKRCASCHRDGGAAFSMVSYDEARPWAKAIREEVLERRMPPWGVVEGIRAYRDDPSLTPVEIEMLVNWVEGGAPEGDPVYLPAKPNWSAGKGRQNASPASETIAIPSGRPLTLEHAVSAVAIEPRDLPAGASMEVSAFAPDGTVEHLIWLRNYREAWKRTYWFSDPVALPGGTRLVVNSTGPAAANLLVNP